MLYDFTYHDDPCTWLTCETAVYSTVWVIIYPLTQCNISEDLNLQNLITVFLHVHILYLNSHSLKQALIITCLKYLPAISQLVSLKLTVHYVLFLYFIQWVTWSHLVSCIEWLHSLPIYCTVPIMWIHYRHLLVSNNSLKYLSQACKVCTACNQFRVPADINFY